MSRQWQAALALAALLGAGGPALAHEMQVLQGGENFEVQWSGGPRDNQVGGGVARLVGGGGTAEVIYDPSTLFGQQMVATMSGGGDDRVVTHSVPMAPVTMLAQRSPAKVPEVAQAPAAPRRR